MGAGLSERAGSAQRRRPGIREAKMPQAVQHEADTLIGNSR
jgi:hypothetical protein